jgi:uroporphyrinogen decarboxylase
MPIVDSEMTKRERVLASLRGEDVDRPPYGFWGHHFDAESAQSSHISSVLWWQRSFDMDYIKVQGRASAQVEDWGVRFNYPFTSSFVGIDHAFQPSFPHPQKPIQLDYPVKNSEDWAEVGVLDPLAGALGERLAVLYTLKNELQQMDEDVPFFIETIFTPLSLAGSLIGWGGNDYSKLDLLKDHLSVHPFAVHQALEAITQSIIGFVKECLRVGVSGFFFATTHWGTYDRMTDNLYDEVARPYDLRILEAMTDAQFNVLHVCKSNNMLFHLADYPVHAFNWADREPGNPDVSSFREKYPDKAILGGVSRVSLNSASPQTALVEASEAWKATDGRSWLAGPDCSVPPSAPAVNIRAVVDLLRLGEP